MKRILVLLTALFMLGFVACGKTEESKPVIESRYDAECFAVETAESLFEIEETLCWEDDGFYSYTYLLGDVEEDAEKMYGKYIENI